MRREQIAFLLLVLAAAFAFVVLFQDTRDNADLGLENTLSIQKSRHDYLIWECEDVNRRNVASTNILIDYPFTDQTREFITRFINKSLPIRDCEKLANTFAPKPPTKDEKGG